MWIGWLLALLWVPSLTATVGAEPVDRQERFKDLARLYAEAPESEAGALLSQMFQLVDSEIIDNLQSGRPFASAAFLQERVDAFSDEWGGASFRILQPERAAKDPLSLALAAITRGEPRGSLRIYGTARGQAALLAAAVHDGVPQAHAWPPARDGAFQFLATWLGPLTAGGGRALSAELWRRGGPEGVRRVWSSAQVFPEGLAVKTLDVKDGRLLVRYEVRYPGWQPGCDGDTEHEDLYRAPPAGDGLVLSRRRIVNGWHRELHAAVTRLLAALRTGDARSVVELVPDATLRARLPRELEAEPACDQRLSDSPATVVVAATRNHDQQRAPWSLSWRRGPRGWRLSAASPVLQ
jgi:hypothetical protein